MMRIIIQEELELSILLLVGYHGGTAEENLKRMILW